MSFGVYADENSMGRLLLRMLRTSGVDVMTANEARTNGLSDAEQLLFADSNGRAILSYDRADFSRLHGAWMAEERHHSGILLITDAYLSNSQIVEAIMALQRERDAAQMRDAILFLSPRKG